jgi:hypothetical protein
MGFWNNQRYEDVERASNGDPIRGLPAQNFPWLLGYSVFFDEAKDQWRYEYSCTGIVPEKNNQKVKVFLALKAETQVSKDNLKKMGISSERLEAMHVFSWNQLDEKYTYELICNFDKIEEKAKFICEKWIIFIKKKYTIDFKYQNLLTKIRSSKISGFSE